MFPTRELVGWYVVDSGSAIDNPRFVDFQQQFAEFIQDPMFLFLNPFIEIDSKRLPISLFLWINATFRELQFKLESMESERVAVDEVFSSFPLQGKKEVLHCSQTHDERNSKRITTGMSALEAQNAALATSLEIMSTNVQSLVSLLTLMKDGHIPADRGLLRKLKKSTKQFTEQSLDRDRCFASEFDQSTIFTSLATYTKSLSIASDLCAKFYTAYTSDWAASSWGPQSHYFEGGGARKY